MALRWTHASVVFVVLSLSGPSAIAQLPTSQDREPAHPPRTPVQRVEVTTLGLLRDRGIISQAEYDAAVAPLRSSDGLRAGEAPTLLLGRWSTTLYGFVEADYIYDTTQSLNDMAGNAQIARPDTYQGTHSRMTFGVRNSRIGLRMRAPEVHHIRVSATLEIDFLGNQPPSVSEAAFFTSPAIRIRHFNFVMETPIVDVLVGQSWVLFAWEALYLPNTVSIQGVPGEIYARTPQLRLSHRFKAGAVDVEIGAAVLRPPERDSGTPDGQAGMRISMPRWTGLTTIGPTGTTILPMSFAITADIRRFALANFDANPTYSVGRRGWALAGHAFVPILKATAEHRGNALSVLAQYSYGNGTADLFTLLSGGVRNAPLPNPTGAVPPPVYVPNVDPSLAVFTADGTAHLIQWSSYFVGFQYYFPGLEGRLWLSANYSHMSSKNSWRHGPENAVRRSEDWFDVNLFGDVTPAVRLGIEYSRYFDHYVDGVTAINNRLQFSGYYLF